MADYNKTPQVMAQVAHLHKLMSDGRIMTADDIKKELNRKWISSVVYYGELETVKDGRRVIGYKMPSKDGKKTEQSKVAATVENAAAASVPTSRSKRKSKTSAETTATPTETLPIVADEDMSAVVAPTRAAAPVQRNNKVIAASDAPVTGLGAEKRAELNEAWSNADMTVDGIDLTIPDFLRKK